MKQATADAFRDWVGIVLLALGWNAPVGAFFGGMLMGMGGASVARAFSKERDDIELWRVLWGGFFFTFMAGALTSYFAPEWPVQAVMGVAGFVSRFGIKLSLDVAEKISGKGSRIADRVIDTVIPGEDGKGDA